jgi:HSP20 family protein
MSSPFEEWFKRRRSNSWFPDIDGIMREMDKMMQEAVKNIEQQVPKNLVNERKLENGSTVREMGPIVYGYSVKIAEDGKPVVRKFENIGPFPGLMGDGLSVKEKCEPLIDIIKGAEEINLVAELLGVNKEDLRLNANKDSLTIESIVGERRYHKKIDLPEEIDPTTGKSPYKNGILEVSFKRKNTKDNGISIDVD